MHILDLDFRLHFRCRFPLLELSETTEKAPKSELRGYISGPKKREKAAKNGVKKCKNREKSEVGGTVGTVDRLGR